MTFWNQPKMFSRKIRVVEKLLDFHNVKSRVAISRKIQILWIVVFQVTFFVQCYQLCRFFCQQLVTLPNLLDCNLISFLLFFCRSWRTITINLAPEINELKIICPSLVGKESSFSKSERLFGKSLRFSTKTRIDQSFNQSYDEKRKN